MGRKSSAALKKTATQKKSFYFEEKKKLCNDYEGYSLRCGTFVRLKTWSRYTKGSLIVST